jgi:hypothetical protein
VNINATRRNEAIRRSFMVASKFRNYKTRE